MSCSFSDVGETNGTIRMNNIEGNDYTSESTSASDIVLIDIVSGGKAKFIHNGTAFPTFRDMSNNIINVTDSYDTASEYISSSDNVIFVENVGSGLECWLLNKIN